MACGEITRNALRDCDNLPYSGINDRFILLNWEDIDTVTYDPSGKHIITGITLKSGKTGYAYEGIKTSTTPTHEMVQGTYDNRFRHQLGFLVFENGGAIKEEIYQMTKGDIVGIVENKHRGSAGEAAFEVYGIAVGMRASAATRDVNDAETGGAHAVTLQSEDDSLEPRLPASLFSTDYATTKAIFDGLYTTS